MEAALPHLSLIRSRERFQGSAESGAGQEVVKDCSLFFLILVDFISKFFDKSSDEGEVPYISGRGGVVVKGTVY